MNRLPDEGENLPRHWVLTLAVLAAREEVTVPVLRAARVDDLVSRGLAVRADGVVDTYLQRTLVDARILEQLGVGGGAARVRLSTQPGFWIALEVAAWDSSRFPYGIRLGMDVLRQGVLSMDGPKGEFDLVF